MPDVLTKNEIAIIDEAKVLAEKIRGRAKLTEELRRIPEETIQELKDTGIFKILRPKGYGGLQLSVETYARVIVELSKACASTGWIASLCAIRELMVAIHPEEAHAFEISTITLAYVSTLNCKPPYRLGRKIFMIPVSFNS